MVRRVKIPGTPYRVRVQTDPASKVDFVPDEPAAPVPVLIEVKGGRSSTASAMRAARVVQELEGSGGTATTVNVEGDCTTVRGEADRHQVDNVARLPFVKRISAA